MLSNKASNGKHGTNKYYISHLSNGFKPLCINIKNIKLYANHLNVLVNDNELLKYIKYRIRLGLYSTKLHSINRTFIVILYIINT